MIDEFQHSLQVQVLTDKSVIQQPDWTWGHQQDHIFVVSRSLEDRQLNWCLKFIYCSLRILRSFRILLWNSIS